MLNQLRRRTHRLYAIVAMLCLSGLTSCETSKPSPDSTTASATPISATKQDEAKEKNTEPSKPSAPSKSINLTESTWQNLLATLTKHSGKIVVIDIWSTSCEPCLRELPLLVSLQKKHGDAVVGISFNCDFIGAKNKPVDYYRERVTQALERINSENLLNFISVSASDELFQEMELDSIPAVYVFGHDGKLVKRFDNNTPIGDGEEGISYEKQINPLVESLIKSLHN